MNGSTKRPSLARAARSGLGTLGRRRELAGEVGVFAHNLELLQTGSYDEEGIEATPDLKGAYDDGFREAVRRQVFTPGVSIAVQAGHDPANSSVKEVFAVAKAMHNSLRDHAEPVGGDVAFSEVQVRQPAELTNEIIGQIKDIASQVAECHPDSKGLIGRTVGALTGANRRASLQERFFTSRRGIPYYVDLRRLNRELSDLISSPEFLQNKAVKEALELSRAIGETDGSERARLIREFTEWCISRCFEQLEPTKKVATKGDRRIAPPAIRSESAVEAVPTIIEVALAPEREERVEEVGSYTIDLPWVDHDSPSEFRMYTSAEGRQVLAVDAMTKALSKIALTVVAKDPRYKKEVDAMMLKAQRIVANLHPDEKLESQLRTMSWRSMDRPEHYLGYTIFTDGKDGANARRIFYTVLPSVDGLVQKAFPEEYCGLPVVVCIAATDKDTQAKVLLELGGKPGRIGMLRSTGVIS